MQLTLKFGELQEQLCSISDELGELHEELDKMELSEMDEDERLLDFPLDELQMLLELFETQL